MGNRSFLYLGTKDQIDQGEGRPFADANNSFPTLWRLLLADGAPAPANPHQRVFGDAGTPNLCSRASLGIARVRQLAVGIREHPLHSTQPCLDLHFDALLAWLDAEAAALGTTVLGDLFFSANLDELSWLDGDAPDDFLARERADCNAIAAQVEAALAAQDFPALDQALEIDAYGASFADWRSWAWNFGFAGIDHPYFFTCDEPRTVSFADFKEDFEPDADDSEAPLGNGLERIRENGLIGVMRPAVAASRHTKAVDAVVIIPAEWAAVEPAGHPRLPLYWVKRGERTGLLRADPTGRIELTPCELDEAWTFERAGERRLAVVRQGGRMGLLSDDGSWIAKPEAFSPPVIEVSPFVGMHAIAAHDERQGVISAAGAWTVPPAFDAIDDLQESGIAIARAADGHRLIDVRSGEFKSEPFATMQWLAGPGVFEGRQVADGSTGWWQADGTALIAPAWDAISLLQKVPWRVQVMRDGLVGVRDREDREWLAPAWASIQIRTDAFEAPIAGHVDEMIVEREGRYGLIDGNGQELIPLRYAAVGEFLLINDVGDGAKLNGVLLQLMREADIEIRYGAWHLDLGRELIPCEYEHLYAVSLYRNKGHTAQGFLAVRHAPGIPGGDQQPLRIGIFCDDGTVLHPTQYAWIAKPYPLTDHFHAAMVTSAIAKAWGADEPVKAALSSENHYVWLWRDGTVKNDLDFRRSQFESGDFAAAHAIAKQYRDGDGLPQDAALARHWLLLAAGQPKAVLEAAAAGLLRRLLGAKAPSPLLPSEPDPRGDVQAMCDLVQEWIATPQDFDAMTAARAWMEIAVTRNDAPASAEAHMLLGYLLMQDIGGAPDDVRAYALSTRAAAMEHTNANFNLGVMHALGRGTPVDMDLAVKNYAIAAQAGDATADLRLGRLLLAKSSLDAKQAAQQAKQAVYHLQRAMACTTEATVAAAKGELGRLYTAGHGVKKDRTRAQALLTEAAAAGDERAIEFLATRSSGSADGADGTT